MKLKRFFNCGVYTYCPVLCIVLSLFSCSADISKIPMRLPGPPDLNLSTSSTSGPIVRTVYIDRRIDQAKCKSYNPDSRRCGNGSNAAFRSIRGALDVARPGTTVLIRQGNYDESIQPVFSGVPQATVTIKNYLNETVTVSVADRPVLFVRQKQYITIEGLVIENSLGWGRLEDAAFITIRKNRFLNAKARGTTGGLKLVRSHFNRVLQNSFERGNDSMVLQESDRNLIEQNVFEWARHSLLSIRCSNFNVIRGNRFHNKRQKAMEIYDCTGVSDAPYRLDATKRNLVELNHFAFTKGPSRPHKYNAIQYAGQYGVVRRNLFYDNRGGGINVQVYSHEALNNYGHRIYHNTFYANKCYGFSGDTDPAPAYGDIIVVNNLFFNNHDCRNMPAQVGPYSVWAIKLIDNGIIDANESPMFVSPEKRDLRLRPDSPMIDKGGFLTRTTRSGSGSRIPVEDVRFFYDGFGILGEKGDLIQLAGTSHQARIVNIDYQSRILELDRNITWRANQGLTTAFLGKSPDIGAHEYPSNR